MLLPRPFAAVTAKYKIVSKTEWKDRLPGGKADKRDPSEFDPKQIRKGVKVELEHTDDPKLALEIALDHLSEDQTYYDKLEQVHKD